MSAGKLRRVFYAWAAAGVLATSANLVSAAASDAEEPAGKAVSQAPEARSAEARLDAAVQRDLGLTMEQFGAAAEEAVAAAASATAGKGPGENQSESSANPGSPSTPQIAGSAEQLFRAYLQEVGPRGLQAVVSSGGTFVIRTGGPSTPELAPDPDGGSALDSHDPGTAGNGGLSALISPEEFVARYANVELDTGPALAPETGVPGGTGYSTDLGWSCSVGFSVFDPAGTPAILTAGHCASDGAASTATLEFQGERVGLLGRFGFSQFGGPGNTSVENPQNETDPANVGTDVAVLEKLSEGMDPLPSASTWGAATEPESDVKIIGAAAPAIGMPICRSGRTSNWSCGTVDAVGIFVVPGPNYYRNPADLRAFHGFLSYGVQSTGGDSGGPYISGNYAVGMHAAGDAPDRFGKVLQNFAVGASLANGLSVLPGYQLEVFLNKPLVTAPAPGAPHVAGQAIHGSVPAAPASALPEDSKIRITMQGEQPLVVPVDANGNWSFTPPAGTRGLLRFAAETVNGFSTSGVALFEYTAAAPEQAESQPSMGPVMPDRVPSVTSEAPLSPAQEESFAPVMLPDAKHPAGLPRITAAVNQPGIHSALARTGPAALVSTVVAAAVSLGLGMALMLWVRRRLQGS